MKIHIQEIDGLKNYSSPNPVVLQSGIHSDINSLREGLGKDLVSDGFNVWLIETVGGPYTDEDCGNKCPNYTFSTLTVYYWPASIAGIQEYSGKNQVDYVGFSLGCSAALESLESFQSGGLIR